MSSKNRNSSSFLFILVSFVLVFTCNAGYVDVAQADEPLYQVHDIGAMTVTNSNPYTCDRTGVFLNSSGLALYTSQGRGFIFQPTAGSRDVGAFYDSEPYSTFYPVGIDDNGNVTGISEHFSPAYQNVIEIMPVFIPDHGTPQSIDLNLPGYDAVQNHNRAAVVASSQDGKHYVGVGAQLNGNHYDGFLVTWTNQAPSMAESNIIDGGTRSVRLCAVNNSGLAVGDSSAGNSADKDPTIRSSANVFVRLTGASLGVDPQSVPQNVQGINNSGLVLLSPAGSGRSANRAALSDGTTFTLLNGLSFAFGLNNFGEVVGTNPAPDDATLDNFHKSHAILFKGGEYIDLNSQIDPNLNVRLIVGLAINDSRTILARGLAADNSEHLYYLSESTPTYQPDLSIGKGASAVGINVFDSTGKNQKLAVSVKVGKSKNISVSIKNAGRISDTFAVKGSKSSAKVSVRYLLGATDITSQVTSGKYKFANLASGKSKVIKVVVTALKKSSVTLTLGATSQTDKTRTDKVAFAVTAAK